MSVIVRAKMITINTKFSDEKCLMDALKAENIAFIKNENRIMIQDGEIDIIKEGATFMVKFMGNVYEGSGERETKETIQKRKLIARIEKQYDRILEEKIERLKYEEKEILRALSEEEREKKKTIMERERARLERIRRKREREKAKKIMNKINKLKEKATMLGYAIEERIEKNERILVLVRRR